MAEPAALAVRDLGGALRRRARPSAGLSLEVGKGEIVGLIGPNGAGKSTTLHAIMGLVPARTGSVTVDGSSVLGHSPESIAHRGVALVPEGRRIYPDFTVEENLRLGLAARRGSRRQSALAGAYELFPVLPRVPQPTGRCALRRPAAAACDRAGHWSRSPTCCFSTSRRSVSRRRSWTTSSRRSRRYPRGRLRRPPRRAARTTDGRARRPHSRALERRAPPDPRPRRRRRHGEDGRRLLRRDERHALRRRRRADPGRRGRSRRRLRADGGRDRARLRRPPPRQLRVRPAGHGRRLHARLHGALAVVWSIVACFVVVVALSLVMDGSSSGPCAAPRPR